MQNFKHLKYRWDLGHQVDDDVIIFLAYDIQSQSTHGSIPIEFVGIEFGTLG
jgi:PleD family two-component response regulator